MPHVGGGSGAGGGGFHSSGHSSKPVIKYDSYGRPHSTYYVRPGFYYNKTYVPVRRGSRIIIFLSPIILVLFAILISLITFKKSNDYTYDENSLANYSINCYSKVYNSFYPSYEYNILVTIVAYENNSEYDYISIVGDEIDEEIDLQFGNTETTFGNLIYQNVSYDNYYETLYQNVARAIDAYCNTLSNTNKYYSENECNPRIVNYTDFGEIKGEEELVKEQKLFFDKTGYNLSIVVTSNKIAYKLSPVLIWFIIAICVLLVSFAAFNIYKSVKALITINKAEKQGNQKIYFEGEYEYEKYFPNEFRQDDNLDLK